MNEPWNGTQQWKGTADAPTVPWMKEVRTFSTITFIPSSRTSQINLWWQKSVPGVVCGREEAAGVVETLPVLGWWSQYLGGSTAHCWLQSVPSPREGLDSMPPVTSRFRSLLAALYSVKYLPWYEGKREANQLATQIQAGGRGQVKGRLLPGQPALPPGGHQTPSVLRPQSSSLFFLPCPYIQSFAKFHLKLVLLFLIPRLPP